MPFSVLEKLYEQQLKKMAQKQFLNIVLIHLYWQTKVTSSQVFKHGVFATASVCGNVKILYTMTLTSDTKCALLCLQKSEKCTGFLHDGVDCSLVAADLAEPAITVEIARLKGFTFYTEFEDTRPPTCGKYKFRNLWAPRWIDSSCKPCNDQHDNIRKTLSYKRTA